MSSDAGTPATRAGPRRAPLPRGPRWLGSAGRRLRRVSVTQDRSVSAAEDLARPLTLPASAYIDESVYARERDRIFARTWQLVARADELSRVGDLKPATILDEPILITRGLDGKLRGFYNVCRHRAAQVVVAKGTRRSLQCPYHGWTYGLDGRLQVAREMEGTENFDKADFGLVPVRVDQWGPFIFANLDDEAPSLGDVLGAIPEEDSAAGYDVDKMQLVERRDYVIECNWKVYVDNYLEGYHIPIAHPGLMKEIDYAHYRTDTYRYYSQQFAPIRAMQPGDASERLYAPGIGVQEALYFWVFPNLMLNIYPDNISTNVIVPLSHEKTLTIFEWFFHEVAAEENQERIKRSVAFSDEVQQEDIGLCEQVQRGLRSSTYDRGRYSVKRENGVHHFHMLLNEFLGRP